MKILYEISVVFTRFSFAHSKDDADLTLLKEASCCTRDIVLCEQQNIKWYVVNQ